MGDRAPVTLNRNLDAMRSGNESTIRDEMVDVDARRGGWRAVCLHPVGEVT
jgi:hypothetical protein